MILLNSYMSLEDSKWVLESLHEAASEHDIPIIALAMHDGGEGKSDDDEYFVQVENFDSLKPLMRTLLPVQAQVRAAA